LWGESGDRRSGDAWRGMLEEMRIIVWIAGVAALGAGLNKEF
jgi:hypothetical protein